MAGLSVHVSPLAALCRSRILIYLPLVGSSLDPSYTADNVSERDFLRTEGDPGAAGYTIKEALALTRSVVSGIRHCSFHRNQLC